MGRRVRDSRGRNVAPKVPGRDQGFATYLPRRGSVHQRFNLPGLKRAAKDTRTINLTVVVAFDGYLARCSRCGVASTDQKRSRTFCRTVNVRLALDDHVRIVIE